MHGIMVVLFFVSLISFSFIFVMWLSNCATCVFQNCYGENINSTNKGLYSMFSKAVKA